MMQFDRISLGRQAKELGFVRDTFEKVCRLADVLSFMERDSLLFDSLALKGGTGTGGKVSERDSSAGRRPVILDGFCQRRI